MTSECYPVALRGHMMDDRLNVDLLYELATSFDAFVSVDSVGTRLSRTDMRALNVVNMRPGLTVGEIGESVGVATGAITRILDHLEAAGYVCRTYDRDDRRRVVVEPTSEARQFYRELFGVLNKEIDVLLHQYSVSQRKLIGSFLRTATELLIERAARVAEVG
jgi:DNA-binding MarR family transcriptional regulator